MGNVQAYGQFESGNLNNTDSINSKKEEQTLFMKLLEEKKERNAKTRNVFISY